MNQKVADQAVSKLCQLLHIPLSNNPDDRKLDPTTLFKSLLVYYKPQEGCENDAQPLNIQIRFPDGRLIPVQIDSASTVADLCKVIEEQSKIFQDKPRLVFKGQSLKHDQTIGSYKLQENNVIHLYSTLHGGGLSFYYSHRNLFDTNFAKE